jgi:hypothetical protein
MQNNDEEDWEKAWVEDSEEDTDDDDDVDDDDGNNDDDDLDVDDDVTPKRSNHYNLNNTKENDDATATAGLVGKIPTIPILEEQQLDSSIDDAATNTRLDSDFASSTGYYTPDSSIGVFMDTPATTTTSAMMLGENGEGKSSTILPSHLSFLSSTTATSQKQSPTISVTQEQLLLDQRTNQIMINDDISSLQQQQQQQQQPPPGMTNENSNAQDSNNPFITQEEVQYQQHYTQVEENKNERLIRESNVTSVESVTAATTVTLQGEEDENWDTFVRRDNMIIDNILTEDEDDVGGDDDDDDDDTERPCVSMFDPALRVLGRGSFGRVSYFFLPTIFEHQCIFINFDVCMFYSFTHSINHTIHAIHNTLLDSQIYIF